ncbi:hypothetical protein EAH75_01035 [Rhodanobacter glycinis]|uniref:Uncharacterized protein n=1 Tax=Rhodanobacter glycinis TaxID=582702 RepID=A0A502C5R9_9GAMM|nr:hypothetical protein EAH88_11380 [Rhodanobacter glycinis]TPG50116.1 hypothetical protein EAH75_01035 [Rhodanobacter glycinis]
MQIAIASSSNKGSQVAAVLCRRKPMIMILIVLVKVRAQIMQLRRYLGTAEVIVMILVNMGKVERRICNIVLCDTLRHYSKS